MHQLIKQSMKKAQRSKLQWTIVASKGCSLRLQWSQELRPVPPTPAEVVNIRVAGKGKDQCNTEIDREVKLLFCARPSQNFCKPTQVPMHPFAKKIQLGGIGGIILCSNLEIKTLQRWLWQRFGNGISDCFRAEVLFSKSISVSLISGRIVLTIKLRFSNVLLFTNNVS